VKFRHFLNAVVILAASLQGVAQSRPLMVAPLFPISYDPQRVHFEPAPPSIGQFCGDLKGRKLWVYSSWRSGETKYFIVSGYLVGHPDGPGPGSIEPDPTGIAVALQGTKCTTDAADWVMSGEVDAPQSPKLPETTSEVLPGHGAPNVCDKYGTCHYNVRSRQEEAVLEGLASNALERFSEAFGGKQAFLSVFKQSVRHPDLIEPVLRTSLDEYRKK
jgi:hypothetical protein